MGYRDNRKHTQHKGGRMTCQCNICKHGRKEITTETYIKSLEKKIKGFEKILADKTISEKERYDAEINLDEANVLLIEIRNKLF